MAPSIVLLCTQGLRTNYIMSCKICTPHLIILRQLHKERNWQYMMHVRENRYMSKIVVVKTTEYYFWIDKCKRGDNETSLLRETLSERYTLTDKVQNGVQFRPL
jgi:hypothetical protein